MDIEKMVNGLLDSNDKYAYQCLKQLEEESSKSSAVYKYFDFLTELLDNENSYIRTRGIVLIAANARWDVGYKIDEIVDKLLRHIMDVKPITARQCIKAMPLLVRYKPNLKDDVVNALYRANPLRYKESMQKLIVKDIQKSLDEILKLSV